LKPRCIALFIFSVSVATGCVARGPVEPGAEQRAAIHPPAQPTQAEIERWHERWERAETFHFKEGRYAQ
jgi:hypothetical protein